MRGHGSKLQNKREQAIAALLAARSQAAAARAVGVSPQTLSRWLRDPAFRAEYAAARRAVLDDALDQLADARSEAVAALRRNLSCGLPAVEYRSASAILRHLRLLAADDADADDGGPLPAA